jgi:membrane-bound lytic murein transglycosylase D
MKSYISLFLLSSLLWSCKSGDTLESESNKKKVAEAGPQCITSVPIPKVVIFAGDTVPLERSDVREALEAELMVNTFRHSHTLSIIKNVARWRPFVSDIIKEMNVPEDFLYLAVIESEFDNNATSYAGAMGMWQIMENTAKDYHLKINKDVDMRRDPKLSTIAACKFLKWSYANLNNWALTAASYNVGVSGIKNRLEEQQVDNFFDLHLNSETGRYVYRIIALKLILENPKAYGYFVPDEEKYTPYQFMTVKITEDIDNLVAFAKKHNTTYKKLRLLNPWFNNTSNFKLSVSKNESYEIRIPLGILQMQNVE